MCAARLALSAALIGLIPLVKATQESTWGFPPPVAPYGMDNLPAEHVVLPLIFPVLGPSRWVDGYGEKRGAFLHTGIDIRATKMTPIVAPFAGRLGMKTMSFWIQAENGWQMLGTHLNDDNPGKHDHAASRDFMFAPDLYPGMHVCAGQFIGYVGESGDATAPHLHFEIYAPGSEKIQGRIRNPFPSLKSAQIIKSPRIELPNAKDMPGKGDVRIQCCIRKIDPAAGKLTVIVVAKQTPSGAVTPLTTVRYLTLRINPVAIEGLGGWDKLKQLPNYSSVAIYLPDHDPLEAGVATRVFIQTSDLVVPGGDPPPGF